MDIRPAYPLPLPLLLLLLHLSIQLQPKNNHSQRNDNHTSYKHHNDHTSLNNYSVHNHSIHNHHKRQSHNHHHDHFYTEPPNGFCRSINDCPIGGNLTCLHVFEGCSHGVCACDPNVSVMENNRCVQVSYGGEACSSSSSSSSICASSFDCVGGVCRCPRDHFLTNDRTRCLKDGSRLVGQACSPPLHAANQQTCLRKIGNSYSPNDVTCSHMTSSCECDDGYKRRRESCVKRRIGEFGCVTSLHCGGGAVCNDGRCVCPTGYNPDGALYKCVRNGATLNLEMGDECDELNERSYCSPGLVCYRCSPRESDKCIKFLLTKYYGNAAKIRTHNIIIIIVTTLIMMIMIT